MQYKEIIPVCSELHTKHVNTSCEENIAFPVITNIKMLNLLLSAVKPTIYYQLSLTDVFLFRDSFLFFLSS